MDRSEQFLKSARNADLNDKRLFCSFLKEGLQLTRMSVRDAALVFKTAPGTVSRWENGHTAPPVIARHAVIRELVTVLNTRFWELPTLCGVPRGFYLCPSSLCSPCASESGRFSKVRNRLLTNRANSVTIRKWRKTYGAPIWARCPPLVLVKWKTYPQQGDSRKNRSEHGPEETDARVENGSALWHGRN